MCDLHSNKKKLLFIIVSVLLLNLLSIYLMVRLVCYPKQHQPMVISGGSYHIDSNPMSFMGLIPNLSTKENVIVALRDQLPFWSKINSQDDGNRSTFRYDTYRSPSDAQVVISLKEDKVSEIYINYTPTKAIEKIHITNIRFELGDPDFYQILSGSRFFGETLTYALKLVYIDKINHTYLSIESESFDNKDCNSNINQFEIESIVFRDLDELLPYKNIQLLPGFELKGWHSWKDVATDLNTVLDMPYCLYP